MHTVETLEPATQPSELPKAPAADAPVGASTRAAAVGPTYRVRALFFLQPIALVLLSDLYDAHDLNNWDLTGFLNANSFSTLRQLLARPEVHFWNPFSFPQYNTGAESVITAILARILRREPSIVTSTSGSARRLRNHAGCRSSPP